MSSKRPSCLSPQRCSVRAVHDQNEHGGGDRIMIRTVRQDRITEIHTMALLAVAVMWVGVVAWMMLEPSPDYEMVSVVVQPGDTLWGLARQYAPSMDPREAVYIIRTANGDIDPGR